MASASLIRNGTVHRAHKALRAACFAVLAILCVSAGVEPASGQDSAAGAAPAPDRTRTVGVYVSPPFVMKERDDYTGMAVDLWDRLAGRLGLRADFVEFDTISDLVNATASGEIDVALTNLTITKDRAQRIDFTHPWFDAGLRIMVNERRSAGFWAVVNGLQASGHLRAYGWIALVILMATVLVTLFDRHFDEDFPRRWRDGIAEGFYIVMSVATSGKPPPRKNLFGWIGRIWQALWLACGIAVLAYVTSSVTSVMTTLSLTNQINSVADLPGRPVAVRTGSVAEQYARTSGLNARSFPHLEEAVDALLDGRVVAIVGDAPVLEYFAHKNPSRHVEVVGAIFEPDKYGFGLSLHSALTRSLTVELIGTHESGRIEEIRTRYFGEDP